MVGIGPLNGTAFPASSRWTVTSKSAVGPTMTDGNGGGDFATELKFAGYEQVIFYGKSPKPVYLLISDGHVELKDATHIWGKTTGETYNILRRELREPEIRTLCIGPAGENQVLVAKILSNITRAGGKGGVPAVMGSKNLKAIAVRGTGSVKIARPKEFSALVSRAYHKIVTGTFYNMFREQGSLFLVKRYAEQGSLPTRNSQSGYFEGWENLTSEAFEKQYAIKHKGCSACPISCSHYFEVKDGPYACHSESNEYGTTYPLGPKLGIDNLAAILKMQEICDQLGLDTHSCGNTIAWAMECWQRGLINEKDTDGIDLSWGNADGVIALLPKIAYRQGFGDLLAQGSYAASKQIPGSEVCLKVVKGQEVSALYLGPGKNFTSALGYATATRGADHLRGGVQMYSIGLPALSRLLGEEGAASIVKEPRNIQGKGIFVALDNDFSALFNSLNICAWSVGGLFGGLMPDEIAELFSAVTGVDMSGDEMMKVGERIYNVERVFNVREGCRRKDDTLPKKYLTLEQTPRGQSGLDETDLQKMLDDFYGFKGWDSDGIPTTQKLKELRLAEFDRVVAPLRGWH
jgi:aldehyde:ferredoxin oxidoreductase